MWSTVLAGPDPEPAVVAALRAQAGVLDDPLSRSVFPLGFCSAIRALSRHSLYWRPVTELIAIADCLPLWNLAIAAIIIASSLAFTDRCPVAALRQGKLGWIRLITNADSFILSKYRIFWFGIGRHHCLWAVWLGWLPLSVAAKLFSVYPIKAIAYLLLPAIGAGIGLIAMIARLVAPVCWTS